MEYADNWPTHVTRVTEAMDRLMKSTYDSGIALAGSLDKLGQEIDRQGLGLTVKLDSATDAMNISLKAASSRMVEAVNAASSASDKMGRRLVMATWFLGASTIVLAAATIALVYVTWTKGA